MVKPSKSLLIFQDRVYFDASGKNFEMGVTDGQYSRRQVQRIVKELMEWLAESRKAPKGASR